MLGMNVKRFLGLLLVVALAGLLLSACKSAAATTTGAQAAPASATGTSSSTSSAAGAAEAAEVEWKASDLDDSYDAASAVRINLANGASRASGPGVEVSGDTVRITGAGTYILTGKLSDGQVVVDAPDDSKVHLVFSGITVANGSTAPFVVLSAGKTIITMAKDTVSTLTDGEEYQYAAGEDEPDGALFSKDDLVINGSGTLVVEGNFKHGIVSKDDLKLVSGTIKVTAVSDGIRGRDTTAVRAANISVTAGSDGIQANNDEDASLGLVYIEGGNITIKAGADGIQAETALTIEGGTIDLTTGGGSDNASTSAGWGTWAGSAATGSSSSAKGLKAGGSITIYGGKFTIDSSDDSVHSNGTIAVYGGTLDISSGDDGIHADKSIVFYDGDIYIAKSYEAVESASIIIKDGEFHLGSSDDGINTSGGNDGSSVGGRPGQNAFSAGGTEYDLTIEGGYIYIEAAGDGIDINGDVTMSAGTLIINGPTSQGNGAIDYNGTFALTGGTVLAAGSSGMAQAPSSESQGIISFTLSTQRAGSLIRIQTASGSDVVTFAGTKDYQSLVYSAPGVKVGETYTVLAGGTSTGTAVDGVYSGGTYSGGTQLGTTTAKTSGNTGTAGKRP